jgi:hypothetical protein
MLKNGSRGSAQAGNGCRKIRAKDFFNNFNIRRQQRAGDPILARNAEQSARKSGQRRDFAPPKEGKTEMLKNGNGAIFLETLLGTL